MLDFELERYASAVIGMNAAIGVKQLACSACPFLPQAYKCGHDCNDDVSVCPFPKQRLLPADIFYRNARQGAPMMPQSVMTSVLCVLALSLLAPAMASTGKVGRLTCLCLSSLALLLRN